MQVNERILTQGVYHMLTMDKIQYKWLVKKVIVTQNSIMAFGQYHSVFEYCDSKPRLSSEINSAQTL